MLPHVELGRNGHREFALHIIYSHECPDLEFELDFDRQTPHRNSGQNPDSAVRRRLVCTITFVPDSYDSKVQILEFLELFEVSSCPFFQILLQ